MKKSFSLWLKIFSFFIFFQLPVLLGTAQVVLKPIWPSLPKFNKPVGIIKAPELPNEYFIIEQRGEIYRIVEKDGEVKRYFFGDFSETVSQSGWETGLLGMAFHSNFRTNGLVYLSYTAGSGKALTSYISQYAVDVNHMTLNANSEKTIIKVSQPYSNHNGGALGFGPDGFLYISWGDGGSAGDPQNNSQNLASLLGKILRIDVDRPTGERNYGIPPDNPFKDKANARPEIFAYGLRNVWQMEIDQATGLIWAGDVGQNAFEEIDIIEKGKNYGWRMKEALSDFKPIPESKEKTVPPFWFYSQSDGNKSVTGGRLYKGKNKAWFGTYWCADYISGRIWSLDRKTAKPTLQFEKQPIPIHISCFGEDANGELLVASHEEGIIYRIEKP